MAAARSASTWTTSLLACGKSLLLSVPTPRSAVNILISPKALFSETDRQWSTLYVEKIVCESANSLFEQISLARVAHPFLILIECPAVPQYSPQLGCRFQVCASLGKGLALKALRVWHSGVFGPNVDWLITTGTKHKTQPSARGVGTRNGR